MAEKKLGDIVIGIVLVVFFLGMFSYVLVDFDSQFTDSDGYGDSLELIYNNSSSGVKEANIESWNNLNNGSFSIIEGSDVDVRGSSDVALIAKNSPSTISNFFKLTGQYLWTNKVTLTMLSVVLVTVVTILTLRFFRPGGI